MRGFLAPCFRPAPSDAQKAFLAMSRGRRSKIAEAAHTTLVKAHEWANGLPVTKDVSNAIAAAISSHAKKKKS